VDPATIGGAVGGVLAAAKTLTELLRGTLDTAKALGKAEIVGELVDLQRATMELLQKQQDLIEENRGLRRERDELTDQLTIKGELEFHHGSYWRPTPDGKLEGPFSSVCWDDERKLVRLTEVSKDDFGRGPVYYYECPKHKTGIEVPARFVDERAVRG